MLPDPVEFVMVVKSAHNAIEGALTYTSNAHHYFQYAHANGKT